MNFTNIHHEYVCVFHGFMCMIREFCAFICVHHDFLSSVMMHTYKTPNIHIYTLQGHNAQKLNDVNVTSSCLHLPIKFSDLVYTVQV